MKEGKTEKIIMGVILVMLIILSVGIFINREEAFSVLQPEKAEQRVIAVSFPDPITNVKTGLNLFSFFNTEIPESSPHVLLMENAPQFENKIDVMESDYGFILEVFTSVGNVYIMDLKTVKGKWTYSLTPIPSFHLVPPGEGIPGPGEGRDNGLGGEEKDKDAAKDTGKDKTTDKPKTDEGKDAKSETPAKK